MASVRMGRRFEKALPRTAHMDQLLDNGNGGARLVKKTSHAIDHQIASTSSGARRGSKLAQNRVLSSVHAPPPLVGRHGSPSVCGCPRSDGILALPTSPRTLAISSDANFSREGFRSPRHKPDYHVLFGDPEPADRTPSASGFAIPASSLARRLNLAGLESRNWSELPETATW